MNTIRKQLIQYGAAIGLTLAAAAVAAHPGQMGGGMRHGAGHGTQQGAGHNMHGGGQSMHGMHGGAQTGAMPHDAKPGQAKPQTGQTLMTPDERTAMREKMRTAKTPEERQQIAQTNHTEMEKRAKEQGMTLPDPRGPQARQGGHARGAGHSH